jgi:hypothetical protein
MSDQDQNNNNNTSNDSNDTYEGMELFEEDIKKAELAKRSNKRVRDDDDDNEEPEFKRQREDGSNESDDMLGEDSSVTSDSDSDSVSDDGEESETDRINTKYSKRFDAVQDYKEKNELLSEKCVEDVMNKLDKDEDLSKQELETLGRIFRLMDKSIPNDQYSLEGIQLYEAFSLIAPSEISENNERIEHHEKKMSEYLARLDELAKEKNEMSSDNESNKDNNSNDESSHNNDSNDESNLDDNSNNDSNENHDSHSPGPSKEDDDDGFDDFPPSFDFDDF